MKKAATMKAQRKSASMDMRLRGTMPFETDDCERRQPEHQRMIFSLPGGGFCVHAAEISMVRAAISGGIGVQHFLIPAGLGHANPIAFPDDRSGVDDEDEQVARTRFAEERDHRIV